MTSLIFFLNGTNVGTRSCTISTLMASRQELGIIKDQGKLEKKQLMVEHEY